MKDVYTVCTFDIRDTFRSKRAISLVEIKKASEELSEHLDNGWSWVILFACFGTCCLVGANNYGVGIIHTVMLDRYKESVSLTAWSGALQLGLMCLTGEPFIFKCSCFIDVLRVCPQYRMFALVV